MNDDSDDEPNRERMLGNEMRAFKNRGFHDGYDEGKKAVIQKAFDSGYQEAFERNFALSTLRGVAQALRSSYNLSHQDNPRTTDSRRHHEHQHHHNKRNSPHRSDHPKRPTSIASTASSSSPLGRTRSNTEDNTTASCSSASSSASGSSCNVSNTTGISSNINVNISSNHLSTLDSMKFDNSTDIESIKSDLIKICRENRLEILAHYVSQIM